MNLGLNRFRTVEISEAADKIRNADRILIIGCSGGGKSTLSRKIADRLGLFNIDMFLALWRSTRDGQAVLKHPRPLRSYASDRPALVLKSRAGMRDLLDLLGVVT